ncbi:MAG: hypothetical protein NVSMB2_20590 [Chloroflexota bacterium]
MFENIVGRLISGALWGLGAGVVITLTREGAPGLRTATRGVIKGYLSVADRMQEATAEAREGLEDLTAEVRAEKTGGTPATPPKKALAATQR